MASLSSVTEWWDETDVLILGFGLAGAVTAIEAHDAERQADVLIVEKMPERYAGGNSRASGQSLFKPTALEPLLKYQRALNEPNPIPESVLRVWGESMVSLHDWIETMAGEVGMDYIDGDRTALTVVEFENLGGREAVEFNATIEPNPSGVWKTFKAHVDRRPIRTRYELPAVDLVQDPDSLEVFGAVVECKGSRHAIRARRAVVMCTGGFENNLKMQRDYYGLERVYTLGTPGNTGDGIHMLQKAGADLWHMRGSSQAGGFWPGFKVPEHETPFMRHTQLCSDQYQAASSWIEVAKDSRRFNNEKERYRENHCKRLDHGHWVDAPHAFVMPVHMIFDQETLSAGPLAITSMSWNGAVEGLTWSEDNQRELDKGWITQGDSIQNLAAKLGRDPIELDKEVEEYNRCCKLGRDDRFGRPAAGLKSIKGPPFYGIEIVPCIVATTGGGRRNERAQVLDRSGEPIPRLLEAGELGSVISNLYQNGCFLTECMVFGRIAGREAVRLAPWTDDL